MIELISRKELLQLNQVFATFITELQDAKYNPSLEHNRDEPGLMHVGENDEEPRWVTQEECDRWNAAALREFLAMKDTAETIPISDDYAGEVIYRFPRAPIDSYVDRLAEGIALLADALEDGPFLFLMEYAVPWQHQDNDYGPVRKALNYLRALGADDDFAGGFKAGGTELKEWIGHLFWLVRRNAALPDCYFTTAGRAFAAHLCKDGNLHVHFYSAGDRSDITISLEKIGMMETERCTDNFSGTGKIAGRGILP